MKRQSFGKPVAHKFVNESRHLDGPADIEYTRLVKFIEKYITDKQYNVKYNETTNDIEISFDKSVKPGTRKIINDYVTNQKLDKTLNVKFVTEASAETIVVTDENGDGIVDLIDLLIMIKKSKRANWKLWLKALQDLGMQRAQMVDFVRGTGYAPSRASRLVNAYISVDAEDLDDKLDEIQNDWDKSDNPENDETTDNQETSQGSVTESKELTDKQIESLTLMVNEAKLAKKNQSRFVNEAISDKEFNKTLAGKTVQFMDGYKYLLDTAKRGVVKVSPEMGKPVMMKLDDVVAKIDNVDEATISPSNMHDVNSIQLGLTGYKKYKVTKDFDAWGS